MRFALPRSLAAAALTLGATLLPAALQAQAAATLPPVAEQIAAAVLPLAPEMREGATVMGYKTKDKLEVLREGKNGMICLALYVTRPDFHVACYHKGLEPFMARGRELRAQGITVPEKVDSARFAEIKSGKLKMPAQGALFSITGKKEQYDAKTNKVTGVMPLGVVYVPFATPETLGISANPAAGGPFLMFPGTPKAHIMIMGKM
jgi:hypothetical protein